MDVRRFPARSLVAVLAAACLVLGCTDDGSSDADGPTELGAAAVVFRDPTEPVSVAVGSEFSIVFTGTDQNLSAQVPPDSGVVVVSQAANPAVGGGESSDVELVLRADRARTTMIDVVAVDAAGAPTGAPARTVTIIAE